MSHLFIEAESFQNLGGWVVDQQSMETMGSSYVMAHGMGVPVAGIFRLKLGEEYFPNVLGLSLIHI